MNGIELIDNVERKVMESSALNAEYEQISPRTILAEIEKID